MSGVEVKVPPPGEVKAPPEAVGCICGCLVLVVLALAAYWFVGRGCVRAVRGGTSSGASVPSPSARTEDPMDAWPIERKIAYMDSGGASLAEDDHRVREVRALLDSISAKWDGLEDERIADAAATVKRLVKEETGNDESLVSILKALDILELPAEVRKNNTFEDVAGQLAALMIANAKGW